jgi:hypothetical protein
MSKEKKEQQPLFALGIRPQLNPDGTIAGYQVQSQSMGLPDETVITIVKNWLRMVEENYYKKFTGQQEPPK